MGYHFQTLTRLLMRIGFPVTRPTPPEQMTGFPLLAQATGPLRKSIDPRGNGEIMHLSCQD